MRHVISRAPKKPSTTTVRIATVNLRAYPANNVVETPEQALRTEFFGKTVDARREIRRRFGKSLSMDRIESALVSAYRGSMQDITDILQETVDTDPHLGSILNKRFGALAALPWEVQPASGAGIDPEKALFYAEVVRTQIRNLKSFQQNVTQLAWALFNGRACLEKNWVELNEDSIAPSHPSFGRVSLALLDMDWIHPRRLSFGPRRELRIQPEMQLSSGAFAETGLSVLDMPDKFIWWTPQLFNDYAEREGLGMRCMYWSFFKRYAARERMILTELYGKPWRIVEVDAESTAGADELKQADAIVDQLGATHTARLPRGVKLRVESPGKSAGDVHAEVIAESDRQNSKLVLGQTGTTDSMPAGMNNNQATVMQDEQLGVLMRDAGQMSNLLETMLSDRIIALNFGELEVTHAPTFRLRADLPSDRTAEIGRLSAALQAGLSIRRDEAYEISGFSRPVDSDVVIMIEQPNTPPNSPVAPATRPMVVYPRGTSPEIGEIQPAAIIAGEGEGATAPPNSQVGVTDATATITVNEDRAARGLPPLADASGALDPRGSMTVHEFTTTIEQQLGADPLVAQVAARRARLASYTGEVIKPGDTPYGDGGVHSHMLNRVATATALDGLHCHIFKLADGTYVTTSVDGAHMHGLATSDANSTLIDGDHMHSIVLANGVVSLTTDDGSAHPHELQVMTSAIDGIHTHRLQMPDPSNPAGYSEVVSLTAAQIAAELEVGTMSQDVFEAMQFMAAEASAPYRVTTGEVASALVTVRNTYAKVVQATRDARAAHDLIRTAQQIEHELTTWRVWCEKAEVNQQAQPSSSNGSVEDLVARGIGPLSLQTGEWTTRFEDAVAGQDTAIGIYHALVNARNKLSTTKFATIVLQGKTQALMLGILDSVKDVANLESQEASIEQVERDTHEGTEIGHALQQIGLTRQKLTTLVLAKGGDFSRKPFKSSLEWFEKLDVLDKPSFSRATDAIKRRSFTVAGVVGDQMLQVIHADLFKAIKAGEDLREFSKRIRPRLQDAGFVASLRDLGNGQKALSASHLETVFRTNTLNSLNTGRFVHQSSASVVAAFPVWEIRAINDTRTRHTHLELDGKKLLATDPFWVRAYPPFGFQCRCRVVPRTKKELVNVVSGVTLTGVPDQGFISGKPSLAIG